MKLLVDSEVLYKKYLTEDLLIIGFESDMSFKAGQFFHLIIDKNNPDDEKTGFRPYSILNSPSDSKSRKVIESYIKLIPNGLGSNFLNSLNVGDKVLLRGPYGRFLFDKDSKVHIFLCTGTGIAPIHSIITENVDSEMVLFYGARNIKELLYHKEFLTLSDKHKSFKYYPTLTQENSHWKGLKGRISEHIGLINEYSGNTFYICGQKEFIGGMLPLIKPDKLIIERYD